MSYVEIARGGRWLSRFVLIGLVAGSGAILFHTMTQLGVHFFMDRLAGYRPPAPAGEHLLLLPTSTPFNRWVLLFLPALGGLLSGWLVFRFAPEAEGHGTDAAIDAYHRRGGLIRGRVPIVKTIASTLTLTTGGSGGREGPIAQIGAGFGSFLATRLSLSERERRIMLAAGIAAGVGSIFRAPLAGALFAAEVLYRDPDFEAEVIIPAGIASVVAYCLFCLVFGWGSLFQSSDFTFSNPLELGPYLVLAVALAAMGWLYVSAFYGVVRLFRAWKFPRMLKPAVGGLATGVIGFFLPEALSFSYGYMQQALTGHCTVPFLLALAFGKIFTTAFSIGSGGSGGVFGPSVVIGGAVGGVVGKLFYDLMPAVVSAPGAFVIVGMAGFFTAVSNTPISTIIFVGEMTGSYHLLLPSLLVCSVSYLLARRYTIFRSQVTRPIDSPAHAGDFFIDILESITVADLMNRLKPVEMIPEDMPFEAFKRHFAQTTHRYFPVKDRSGRLAGIFSSTDIRAVLFSQEIENLVVVKDIATTQVIATTPAEDLNTVMRKFTARNIDSLPVVSTEDPCILLGMLDRRDLIAFYNQRLQQLKDQTTPS